MPSLKDPKHLLAKAHVAVHASTPAGAPLPSKGGSAALDIMGADEAQMLKLLNENCGKAMDGNVVSNDKWMKSLMADQKVLGIFGITSEDKPLKAAECIGEGAKCPVRTKVFKILAANWASGGYTQAEGTPKQREQMPQLDHEIVFLILL